MGNNSGNFRAQPVDFLFLPKDQGQAPNYRYPEIDGESANLVTPLYIKLNNHDLAFSKNVSIQENIYSLIEKLS